MALYKSCIIIIIIIIIRSRVQPFSQRTTTVSSNYALDTSHHVVKALASTTK